MVRLKDNKTKIGPNKHIEDKPIIPHELPNEWYKEQEYEQPIIPHEHFTEDFFEEQEEMQLKGMKFDDNKLRWDLLPVVPVEQIVEIITHGSKKYAPENWKNVDVMRFYSAAMRHLTAWKKGEEFDKDSGLTHLAHVGCNILFMMWIEENKVRHYPKITTEEVFGKPNKKETLEDYQRESKNPGQYDG